jgi:CBS domain-containing protein
VGVVTDRDMVVRGLAKDSLPDEVRDVMTPSPVTVKPTSDFRSAMRLMREHKVGRLPVVDDAMCLKGVVSLNDLARASSDSGGVNDLAKSLGEAHQPTSHGATPAMPGP